MSDEKDPKGSPSEPPTTPINSSGAYPVFRKTAEDLAKRLETFNDPDAWLMAGELRYYAERFASWGPKNRPDEAVRKKMIDDYMSAYRKTLDYFIQQSKKKP